MLELDGVDVSYPGLPAPVLSINRLTIAAGEHVAVTGASGSGKSTLVNVVTGLERVATGRVQWNRLDVARLPEGARDRWRADTVGLVMQDFHLFAGLSALDNVLLPARLCRVARRQIVERAHGLLDAVGIGRPGQRVETMSRGEMQRVAIARALLREPRLVVADEPTASLDAVNGAAAGALLVDLATASGATLFVVTHDPALSGRLGRKLTLSGGRIVADERRDEATAA
ncbi:ATP-binding cassette domain-containing protein [Rhizobium sp. TRM95111]|uniref:ABC transporter ATP-binding protein n=1 Tax=Rhizobium alarense TaxID=2846851 RepID=UPI001F3AF169|nr:ATP-binding cassette domain-containing protein [Rhizobium alarense]MCF3642398.1 ATP-binding cassette domain-containing protein [Rhizobium alarense]